jgi:hypothetical protein
MITAVASMIILLHTLVCGAVNTSRQPLPPTNIPSNDGGTMDLPPELIPPPEVVQRELNDAIRRVRILKQLLKLSKDAQQKTDAVEPAGGGDAGL